MTGENEVVNADPVVDSDFTDQDFASTGTHEEYEDQRQDAYQPPPGFKLIPEDYVAVEPTMYALLLKSLGNPRAAAPPEIRVQMPEQPKEAPDEVFHIRLLQQLTIGDIGYNFGRGEEFSYCPEKKYLEVGGDRYTTIRSFLNIWNAHFGPRPDPNVRAKPFFLILNPESCPPIGESLGRRTPTRFRSDEDRVRHEESRGDAAHHRVHVHGETGEYSLGLTTTQPVDPRDVERIPDETMHPYRRPGNQNPQPQQPSDPYQQSVREYSEHLRRQAENPQFVQPTDAQMELNAMLASRTPVMPPRAGVVGQDGLTPRARMIKQMSGDQIQRPVQRQQIQPVGGYEPSESVENFQRETGVLGGGRVVGQIPGGPADEATAQAQMNDIAALRLQGHRTQY